MMLVGSVVLSVLRFIGLCSRHYSTYCSLYSVEVCRLGLPVSPSPERGRG